MLIGEPSTGAKYYDERVYLSVCFYLYMSISAEPYVQSFPILCVLPMAEARSSSGSVVIRYLLPVQRNVTARNKATQKRRILRVTQQGQHDLTPKLTY